jgi:hypothetical protein
MVIGKEGTPVRTLIVTMAAVLAVAGCRSVKSSRANPALKSERQYAENAEARAQDLYRIGQTSSLSAARAQAAGEANND